MVQGFSRWAMLASCSTCWYKKLRKEELAAAHQIAQEEGSAHDDDCPKTLFGARHLTHQTVQNACTYAFDL